MTPQDVGSEDAVAGEAPAQGRDRATSSVGTGDAAVAALVKAGFTPGTVVQELGWDDDVDDDLRAEIEEAIDGDLVADATEAADAVVLWWRDDDGDVSDGVMDALIDLSDHGVVWVLTPKVGRPGHVDPADVAEAADTAGLNQTSTVAKLSKDWSAAKLVRPRGGRR